MKRIAYLSQFSVNLLANESQPKQATSERSNAKHSYADPELPKNAGHEDLKLDSTHAYWKAAVSIFPIDFTRGQTIGSTLGQQL